MNNRKIRLEELLQKEIAVFLSKRAPGEFSGLVTLTCVRFTPDLQDAVVYYSVLGSEADRESAAGVFARLKRDIVSALRPRITIKHFPSISFEYDPTPKQAAKIESIFNYIENERHSGENPTSG